MIKSHLSVLMGIRRVKIADVHRDTGINRNTLSRLYHDQTERISLDDLDKLCRYFGCNVNELLAFEPSD